MSVGKRLRRLRERKGITSSELAQRLLNDVLAGLM